MSEGQAQTFESKKIKSAVFIDFILSVEIVIIALSSVINEPIEVQIPVVTGIALVATVGVYGLVALLVRIDDFGLKLIASSDDKNSFSAKAGTAMVKSLPVIIRSLTVVGTVAMILVAGGIYVHNIHAVHDLVQALPSILGELLVGLVVGFVALLIVSLVKKLMGKGH
jgi:predicted DNA repair protein MutK